MDFQDRLTILIPTYNRKERLIETLRSISSQGYWGQYSIVIVDNCSDYSIEEALQESFEVAFIHMITIHRWFFNTGMTTNISIAFEFVRTKWCWFISDDDIILDGALSVLFKDMKEHHNYVAIKYSIEGVCSYNNAVISSFEDWAQFYIQNNTGDKCYLSMLYNISVLYPYLSELTVHSYCYLSFWLPILKVLNEKDAQMLMSSSLLYKYKQNNDGWSSSHVRYLNTLLGIRTLYDFEYGLTPSAHDLLKRVYADMFDSLDVVRRISKLDKNEERKRYYGLLKGYMTGKVWVNVICTLYLYLVIFFNISDSNLCRIHKFRRRVCNM